MNMVHYGTRLLAYPYMGTPRFDCHIHTAASFDSEADVLEIGEAAIRAGLAGIAITDHVEMVGFDRHGAAQTAALSWELATRAREAFAGRLTVLCGIELGEPLYDAARAQALLARYPYDLVLASVHQLGDEPDYYYTDATGWTPADVHAMLARYFEEVLAVARWGRFDVLAHLTYPVRYLPAVLRPTDYTPWSDVLDEIFRTLATGGRGLERNTSGLRKGAGETAPPTALLERFRALGGTLVTHGSDAHSADEVGG